VPLLPFLNPFRAGGDRLGVLVRAGDRCDTVGCGERVGEGGCDLEGEASLIAAVGVPDRVRERPREGERGDEAIFTSDD
jgi:hypothetical protein